MVRTSLPRVLIIAAASIAGLAGIAAPAALAAGQNSIPDRINASASSGSPVAIPQSIHPSVKSATDLGPASPVTRLDMSIRFNMTGAQQAAVDQLLIDQQNPASPSYHQWLTPIQYGAQFGLSSTDIAKVTAWLTSQGFTVTGVAPSSNLITFDGTVAQAQAAFATSIHNVSLNGETHFANVTNVSVPSAFADVVMAVTGLHNFRFKPHLRTSIVKPQFTSSVSNAHFVAPGDLYTIYNVNPLLTSSINGAGMTIAVTGQVDIYSADVLAFRAASGLSTTNLPVIIPAGTLPSYPICNSCDTGPNEGDLNESSIDVEYSGAMAPNATIDFIAGLDVFNNSMPYAIVNNVAPIVTTSYGACEAGWGTTELLSLNALFKQANLQGQTVLAAAADEGATDCDAGPSAIEGLAVDFPGSSPYVTSMGGTQLNDGTALGATSFWSATNGATAGSALSYISEAAWNDETEADYYGGGGGGPSAFFTKPTWQVGNGVPADASRDEPDLSLDASDAHDPFLYCVNTAAAQGAESCGSGFRVSSSNTSLTAAGGTSFDSQIFGGLLALVEQKIGSRIGNANPTIYALANSIYYAAGQTTLTNSTVVFNDVTTGSNAMPCSVSTPNCGNGGSIGFNAGNGYDLATGWGSVNVTNLANDWPLVKALGSGSLGANISTTALTASPSSVTAGATVTLTATVTGSAGTPTGSVVFLTNNVALGTAVTVTALNATTATASYTWTTSCSNLGQQVLSASYSGDVNYQGSKGPVLTAAGSAETSNGSFVVTPVEVQVATNACPDFSIAPTTSSFTVAAGGTIPTASIAVTPINSFTGSVTFTATATSTSGYAPTLSFSPASITVPATTSTTLTFSGITAGLRLPNAPGQIDSGTMLARQSPAPSPNRKWYAAGSGVTIASLLLLTLPRRRRLGGLLLIALSISLIGGASGCASSQAGPPSSGSTTTNPEAGIYVVTVVGTYTSTNNQVTQHSTVITYTIN